MKRDPKEQAEYLHMSEKTLANWRYLGLGPPYLKIGAKILYEAADTELWLARLKRTSTSDPGPTQAGA